MLQTRLCLFNDCATFSRKNRFRRCCVCDIHLELRRVHGITWQYKFSIILRPIELLFSDKLPTISDTATSCVKSIIFTLMRNSETSVGRWKILRSCLFLPSGNEIMRPRSCSIDIGEKQENCSTSLSESESRIIDKFVT